MATEPDAVRAASLWRLSAFGLIASQVEQLLNVTNAPYDTQDPSTKEGTIEGLLWYNVFVTDDGMDKLGGQPFGNQDQVYTGSEDDAQLNQAVQRFNADQAALDEIAVNYQTTGHLSVPLVTLHTTGDPLVPYWHASLYRGKTIAADNIALHEHLEADCYGHCNFAVTEVLYAFTCLVNMVDAPPPYQPVSRSFLPLVMSAPWSCGYETQVRKATCVNRTGGFLAP